MSGNFENGSRFRTESKTAAQEVLARVRGELQKTLRDIAFAANEGVENVRAELLSRTVDLRAYIESDDFERDLDRLAQRLEVDGTAYSMSSIEDRSARVKAKAQFLLLHARHSVARATEKGGLFAMISRRSRVVMAIAAVCGGLKSAEIAYECYRIFAPAHRRRSLRVV